MIYVIIQRRKKKHQTRRKMQKNDVRKENNLFARVIFFVIVCISVCVCARAQALHLLNMWWIWMQWFPAYWRHLNSSKTLWRQIAIQTEQNRNSNNKTKQCKTEPNTYDNDTTAQPRQCKEVVSCASKNYGIQNVWMNIIQRSSSNHHRRCNS